MRAAQYRRNGGPEVLEVAEVPRPEPGPKDLLVEVAAASVNAIDLVWRRGGKRILNGRGFPKGTGMDFAGTVREGDRLLVVGGNGGVGTTAIQLATALGASVDAVTGSEPAAALQAGAERAFDYHSVAPERIPGRYTAILDAVGADSLAYRSLLAPGGRMTLITTSGPIVAVASAVRPGPRIRMMSAGPSRESLTRLARAVDDGPLRPIIAARYCLDGIAQAHRDAEELPAAGKRIIIGDHP